VAFQTVANNRIITPSIMGFESLYVAIQTGAMYFFGVTAITHLQGLRRPSLVQLMLMVGLSLALYGWLLSGRHGKHRDHAAHRRRHRRRAWDRSRPSCSGP
jgi:iron complex transport system permease protein